MLRQLVEQQHPTALEDAIQKEAERRIRDKLADGPVVV